MSKGNLFLGHARGSVGDVTFYRRNGQQITRAKAKHVTNPNTEGQAIQRMIFGTVQLAYKRMSSIVDHSFESVKYGADSMARFMQVNLKRLRADYVKDIAEQPDRLLADLKSYMPKGSTDSSAGVGLIIAAGSLPAVPIITDNETGQLMYFGNALESNSIANVLSALGAVPGDQITVCALAALPNTDDEYFYKSRYVVNVDATAEQLAAQWTADGSAAAFDSTKTQVGMIRLVVDQDEQEVNRILAGMTGEEIISGVGVILSRKSESGKWLRSNTVLYNKWDEHPMYSAGYALPSWRAGVAPIETTSDKYLNNADE